MNRIILIGNGFDLAHGMKTRYKDFLFDLWNQIRLKSNKKYQNEIYQDDFVKFKKIFRSENEITDINSIEKFLSDIKGNGGKLELKNNFLVHLIKIKKEFEWVDFETEYYKLLKRKLEKKGSARDIGIKTLNQEFVLIKIALEKYLNKAQDNFIKSVSDHITYEKIKEILYQIYLPINEEDLSEKGRKFIKSTGDKLELDEVCFLNFNYTRTQELYTDDGKINHYGGKKHFSDDRIINIHIHGELGNSENPIVFGYGDELDESYSLLEKSENNQFLENIKSIRYLESNSYKNLLRFIYAKPYQIIIMGHSCGLSDRTLLNTLFEHENCHSIKVFYRENEKGNNFRDIVQNISRNFTNKADLRDKVVNKTRSVALFE